MKTKYKILKIIVLKSFGCNNFSTIANKKILSLPGCWKDQNDPGEQDCSEKVNAVEGKWI